jgi:glycolate oxidase FAD binding subunit
MYTADKCRSPTFHVFDFAMTAADPTWEELRERIVAARAPLRIRGSGTKDFYGETFEGDILDTRGYTGIVSYEASELVITARCGTPLSDIESALAENNQFLAFEPPRFGGDPTIGGVIAAGLSGPRRATAGAARDFVLGATLLDARGERLRFGGQVMKNVAGFDMSRLLCGSLGILGLITEVSIKVLPKPRAETTLRFEMDTSRAIDQFNRWSAQPLPISATAWHHGVAYVRLSGASSAVRAAQTTLGGDALDDHSAHSWWNGLRDQTVELFRQEARLWRVSVPSTATLDLSGTVLIEWAGALRWIATDLPAAEIRAIVSKVGGTAMLRRGARDASMFHPLDAANLELHRRLKQQFDPDGIFNPGRLIAEL